MLINFLLALSRRAEAPTDANLLAGGGFHIQYGGKLVARYGHSIPVLEDFLANNLNFLNCY
jgi:hypothetical protein